MYEVIKINQEPDGALLFTLNRDGEEVYYAYRETDKSDDAESLRLWMRENPSFPVHPFEPQPEPMRALTPREFRDALVDEGIPASSINAVIDAIPNPQTREKARNAWEYSTEFVRSDPLISVIGQSFNLDEDHINTMWRRAMGI